METPALIFREDRRIRSPFVWIFLVVASSFVLGSLVWMVRQRLAMSPEATHGAMATPLYLAIVTLVVCTWLCTMLFVALVTLQIEVTSAGLFVRFWPIQRKVRQIPLAGVTAIRAVRFRPLVDYGGYGVRRNRRSAAYLLGTGEGVRIDYENGYHLLLETAHPWELEEAIKCLWEPDAAPADAPPPTA